MFNKLYLHNFKLKQIVLLMEINKSKTEFHIFFFGALFCSRILQLHLLKKKVRTVGCIQIYRDMALESDVKFGVVWSGRGSG